MKQLKNKTAVITGCLKGIGSATLDAFAKNGANVFACCQPINDKNKDDFTYFDKHIEELKKDNDIEITPLYFDLQNEMEIKYAMRQIISSKKQIDALINIAGITQNSLFQMTTIDSMRELFEIDFFSQMLITQNISKIMMKYKSGSIVNIASITGIDGNSGQISYSAAKAALIGATKTLAIELGNYNIRVNAVSPGVIKTSMTDELSKDKFDELLKPSKIKRPGLPEEVAELLVFLASDRSISVTSQNIRIDGGIGG